MAWVLGCCGFVCYWWPRFAAWRAEGGVQRVKFKGSGKSDKELAAKNLKIVRIWVWMPRKRLRDNKTAWG